MYQKTQLIGRIGYKKPGVTASQVSACQYSIATEKSFKRKGSDDWETDTTWHRIVSYNKCAEQVTNKFEPGDLVRVEGELRTREYKDRDGVDRSVTELVVEDFPQRLPKFWKRDGQSLAPDQNSQFQPDPASPPAKGHDSFDDDIPF